jgi:hypothetical protein
LTFSNAASMACTDDRASAGVSNDTAPPSDSMRSMSWLRYRPRDAHCWYRRPVHQFAHQPKDSAH